MMFLASIITFFVKNQFLTHVQSFIEHSIKIIRFAGILGIIWFLMCTISYFSVNSNAFENLFSNSTNTQEKLLFSQILVRFSLLFGLTQLFWIKKIRALTWLRNIIAFFIMFIAISHGIFLEKTIIFFSLFHRDYLPSNYSMFDNFYQHVLYFICKSCLIFTLIVLIVRGISLTIKRENV